MGLRTKFNLALLGVFTAGMMVAALLIHASIQSQARAQLRREATLMMREVNAAIDYTTGQVNPLLTGASSTQFLPQEVPFYAAAQQFHILSRRAPDYALRQPALDPTNPADRPAPWERKIINGFVANPSLKELTLERQSANIPILSYAEPVQVNDRSCLVCHSDPKVAPASMIDVYGGRNGFGWHLGQIVGAEIVSVPERAVFASGRANLLAALTTLALVFAAMLAMVNVLLHVVIVAPLRRISKAAEEVSLGNMEQPEFSNSAKDEIGALAAAFNRMRRSLVTTMGMLED